MRLKEYLLEASYEMEIPSEDMKKAGATIRELGIIPTKSGFKEGSKKYFFVFRTAFTEKQLRNSFDSNKIEVLKLEVK